MDKLNICGVEYDVVWVDKPVLSEGQEHWGFLEAEVRRIRVYIGLSERDAKHVIVHEICHELLSFIRALPDESEDFVKTFTRLFFDTLDRNEVFTKDVKPCT